MWRHCGVILLALAAALFGTVWGQDTALPEGTQDGPCPNVASTCGPLDWSRLTGTWNEFMRMKSEAQPNQCPTSNVYTGTPPNVTVTILATNADGTVRTIPRAGVIQDNVNQRLFSNPRPSPGFPDPNGLLFETIYTDYRNVHVFWTCANLEGNKNINYVWIETRAETLPERIANGVMRKLTFKGIDTSRFWRVGAELCTEAEGEEPHSG